jgi:hypothetical protein
MELTLLLSSLPENSYHSPFPTWPVDINDFRILDGSATELHPNILYLGASEHLPALSADAPLLTFFVYGDQIAPPSYHNKKVNLLFIPPEISPLTIYDELHFLFEHTAAETPLPQMDCGTLSLLSSSRSRFLTRLLSAFQPHSQVVEHEAAKMKYSVRGHYYLAVVRSETGRFTLREFAAMAEAFHGLNHNIQPFIFQFQLLLFFDCDTDVLLQPEMLKGLRDIAVRYHAKMGISNYFCSLLDIRRYYTQAQHTLTVAEAALRRTPLSPVFLFQEYSYGELFSICASEADLSNYVYPPLMELLEYDQANDTQLMNTLFVYLQHNCHAKDTAKNMFMHKNTILYRINKIKEMLHLDLSDGESVFLVALSMRILIYMRLFVPQKAISDYASFLDD